MSRICIYAGIGLMLLLMACKTDKEKRAALPDSPLHGTITISADESFKPVVDELIRVYESNTAGTRILVEYKSEAECVKDLYNDSIRMILSTLRLTEAERQSVVDSIRKKVVQIPVARDAIAVILNRNHPLQTLSIEEIRQILTGIYSRSLVPVFDGVTATSTVRYMIDSVLKGTALTSRAAAARSSDSVIQYVMNHPDAMGFIGVSWIGNPEDPAQLKHLEKVKIIPLESNDTAGKYILPTQENIYTKAYPLTRDLTYILKERGRGLGTGFAEFITGEIGQLIFKRAYLMPGRRSFILRPAELHEE
ncbi:hypothetical protein GCM10027051_06960 [Niabella terrae]